MERTTAHVSLDFQTSIVPLTSTNVNQALVLMETVQIW